MKSENSKSGKSENQKLNLEEVKVPSPEADRQLELNANPRIDTTSEVWNSRLGNGRSGPSVKSSANPNVDTTSIAFDHKD